MNTDQNTEKNNLQYYHELENYFSDFLEQGICVAYSGGVDSTLLLKAAVDCAKHANEDFTCEQAAAPSDRTLYADQNTADGQKRASTVLPVLAVILETQLHPHSDIEQAQKKAAALGAQPIVIQIDEFQNPLLLHNPKDRCYLCKHLLFSRLKELAASRGYRALFDGTNKDDELEYRPGMKALAELQIKSPLRELGITKTQVRAISSALGLSTATIPSTPCLATRLPYGAILDRELLARIHQGELLLRDMGFYNVRLRYHAPILRLEIDSEFFTKLLSCRATVLNAMKKLGFSYITLDLEGFRSGSMDIGLI